MAKKARVHDLPHDRTQNNQQLAALSTLLGVMMKASKLCEELDSLTNTIGGSLEELVHSTFARGAKRTRQRRAQRA
jgi:hypothetical protein